MEATSQTAIRGERVHIGRIWGSCSFDSRQLLLRKEGMFSFTLVRRDTVVLGHVPPAPCERIRRLFFDQVLSKASRGATNH